MHACLSPPLRLSSSRFHRDSARRTPRTQAWRGRHGERKRPTLKRGSGCPAPGGREPALGEQGTTSLLPRNGCVFSVEHTTMVHSPTKGLSGVGRGGGWYCYRRRRELNRLSAKSRQPRAFPGKCRAVWRSRYSLITLRERPGVLGLRKISGSLGSLCPSEGNLGLCPPDAKWSLTLSRSYSTP